MYDELYEVSAKNAIDKDWNVAKELIDELNYPFFNSRENRVFTQLKAIAFILSQFEIGKKAILLDAPVGIGKSLINITVALNTEGKSFIAMPQKILQAQYIREFPDLCTEIKGRGNYNCRLIDASCADGKCRRNGKFKCGESGMCPYWIQKEKALDAKICVSNFSYFALEGGNAFGSRELLVIDEGDDIAESSILDLCSVTISYRTMGSLYTYLDFKKDDVEVLHDAKELLEEEISEKEGETDNLVDVRELDAFKDLYGRIKRVEDDWVAQRESTFVKGRHSKLRAGVYESLVFKPLSIAKFAKDILWSRADKFLISSATILNKNMYIKETGLDFLDPEDIVYVVMNSLFDVERRPIYYLGDKVGKLTAKEMNKNFPKAITQIMRIIKEHPGQRGLIHCTSFKNVTSIYNFLNMSSVADRMIYHTNQTDRNDLVRMMMSGETPDDSVVVSPSLTRGVDLKGDLCRFVIMLKVPYPNTLDKRIKIRSKDFRWYSLNALRETVQAYGRGMRASDDFCDTYVLDAGFKGLMNGAAKRSVPKWFKNAIIWR